jgi:hypothetical protein
MCVISCLWSKDMRIQELGIREANLMTIRKLLGFCDSLDTAIVLAVEPMAQGAFGVYANTVLVASYPNNAAAHAYCLRLRKQQVTEET